MRGFDVPGVERNPPMAERGSDRHGFRLDDEMSDEVESLVRSGRETRADESRVMEGPADDEPITDFRTASALEAASPHALSREEAEERGFLADNLDLKIFPADREALITSAEQKFAPAQVLDQLRTLPQGKTYETVTEVWQALGGRTEHRVDNPEAG
jgi:Protein of unknown function (DUF2795)